MGTELLKMYHGHIRGVAQPGWRPPFGRGPGPVVNLLKLVFAFQIFIERPFIFIFSFNA
jgi:hypothetical protein